MSGNSDKAMMEYLNALLEEEKQPLEEFDSEPVKRLLSTAQILEMAPTVDNDNNDPVEAPVVPAAEPEPEPEPEPELSEESALGAGGEPPETPPDAMAEYQRDGFQALFFNVAGLTLAVPLKSLGGIYTLSKVSPIFGKPDWFKGIMTERERKLQVVDTARWVMPEKLTPEVEENIEYQYLITLNESPWGLLCEELVDSEPLPSESIQWRQGVNQKRPWLAGVVRERMCALLDVNALIKLLDKGLGHIQSEAADKPE